MCTNIVYIFRERVSTIRGYKHPKLPSDGYTDSERGVVMVDFGGRLKLLRLSKKLTQEQLSERIGVTKSMISAYETSMRLPSFDVLIKFAYEFKVTTDYLLGVDKRTDLEIPSLTDKQKKAIINMLDAFANEE